MRGRRRVLWVGVLCGCPTPLPPPIAQTDGGSSSTSVEATGDPPTGAEDSYCLQQGAPREFSAPYSVLDNDDPGTSLAPDSLDAPIPTNLGGSVEFQPDGSFTYTMPTEANVFGLAECEPSDICLDSFTYRIRDDASGVESDDIEVQLQISPRRIELAHLDEADEGLRIYGLRQTGVAVSPAGDVNGDEIPDLLIGAHRSDAMGTTGLIGDSGQAAVLFGGMNEVEVDLQSPGSFHGFLISGAVDQSYVGYGLADAGDVDGDEYDDVVVSAIGTGMVFLIYGGPDLDGEVILAPDGPTDGARGWSTVIRGASSSLLGTFVDTWRDPKNPAGSTWLIAAAMRHGAGGEGAALWRPLPDDPGDLQPYDIDDPLPDAGFAAGSTPWNDAEATHGFEFGSVVRALGAVGDDDQVHVAIMSDTRLQSDNEDLERTNSDMRGRVHIVPAIPGANVTMRDVLDGTYGNYLEGSAGDRLGRSIDIVGDLDHDGSPDVAIGAPGRDYGAPQTEGMVYVLFGDQLLSQPATTADLERGGDRLLILGDERDVSGAGYSVSGAGDFNGDGIDDLVIGAPSVTDLLIQTCDEIGRVYVIFGGEDLRRAGEIRLSDVRDGFGGLAIEQETELNASNGCLGWYVAGVGDVDEDGLDDVLIGAPGVGPQYSNSEYTGRAYIVHGFSPTHSACP